MAGKKEARQTWKSGRASVNEDDGSISQIEIERGMHMLWLPFAAMLALYAVWELIA